MLRLIGTGLWLIDFFFLVDINECEGDSGCQQGCMNTAGGFTCTCDTGFISVNATHCQGKTKISLILVNLRTPEVRPP